MKAKVTMNWTPQAEGSQAMMLSEQTEVTRAMALKKKKQLVVMKVMRLNKLK